MNHRIQIKLCNMNLAKSNRFSIQPMPAVELHLLHVLFYTISKVGMAGFFLFTFKQTILNTWVTNPCGFTTLPDYITRRCNIGLFGLHAKNDDYSRFNAELISKQYETKLKWSPP